MDAITIDLGYCSAIVRGELPEPQKKTLLCIGCSDLDDVLADAKAFRSGTDCDVAVCNEAASVYPGAIDYLVSLHTHLLPGWFKSVKYKKSKPLVVGSKPVDGVDISIAASRPVGSSAMLMVMLGKALGYERIVLCGVTMGGPEYEGFRPLWSAAKAQGMLSGVETLTGGWVARLLQS